ncbi:E3 ubiquitin-protein ligase TRIM38 isoform X1 [Centroberyx gerrardi]
MYKNHIKDTNNNYNKSLLSGQKEKLVHAIKRIKHEVDECREAEREMYIESVQVENKFDDLEREIRAEFQNLHRFLDEEECMDLERLKKEREKQVKQLKEREKKIAEQGKDLERAITVLNSKLTEEDSPKLLRDIQDLIKRQVVSVCFPKLTVFCCLPHFPSNSSIFSYACLAFPPISAHQSISIILSTRCCRSIIHHYTPPLFPRSPVSMQVSGQLRPPSRGGDGGSLWTVCGSHPVQDMETHEKLPLPKYAHICHLIQHMQNNNKTHCILLCPPTDITSVTFDPETAHPNLSLSASCTSVWFEEEKDMEACQVNPRRFHYYYCVMGHQGFTTGRHYWEVEVGRKTAWRVGVAREDVQRGEMAASGTSSGLWTLSMKGGVVLACTDPKPTRINASTRLVRIGVFLDCDKEEVSFYNAVTMAPLYTFTMGTVLVPLFPFYNPCDTDDGKNTGPINIFSPTL